MIRNAKHKRNDKFYAQCRGHPANQQIQRPRNQFEDQDIEQLRFLSHFRQSVVFKRLHQIKTDDWNECKANHITNSLFHLYINLNLPS